MAGAVSVDVGTDPMITVTQSSEKQDKYILLIEDEPTVLKHTCDKHNIKYDDALLLQRERGKINNDLAGLLATAESTDIDMIWIQWKHGDYGNKIKRNTTKALNGLIPKQNQNNKP